MVPPANGWLQHADAAASGNPCAAKPADGWGQGVAAGGGGVGSDGVDAGGVDAGGGGVGSVDPLTCQRLSLVVK